MSDLATIETLEIALLGAAMVREDMRLEIIGNIESEWWQSLSHRNIFLALRKLVIDQKSVDWPNMVRSLRDNGKASLADCVIDAEWAREAYRTGQTLTYESLATDHIPALHDAYVCRALASLPGETMERLSHDSKPGSVASWLVDRVQAVMARRMDDRPISDADLMQRMVDDSQTERADPNDVLGYTTGIAEFEEVKFRLVPGHTVIVGGRTSHGKSVLGRQFADAASIQCPTLVFALEPGERGWVDRRAMSLTGCSPLELRARTANNESLARLQAYATQAAGRELFVTFGRPRTTHDILTQARAFKTHYPRLGVVIIDQLYNVVGWTGNGRESRDLAPMRITHELREGFSSMNICCVALHQLNRTAKNGEPVLESLADSTRLEQEANEVLLAWRPGFVDDGDDSVSVPDDIMKVKIAKWRDGKPMTVVLPWNGQYVTAGTFTDPYVERARRDARREMNREQMPLGRSA